MKISHIIWPILYDSYKFKQRWSDIDFDYFLQINIAKITPQFKFFSFWKIMSETPGVTKNEGIQKLLEAEKEATKIVDEARQR